MEGFAAVFYQPALKQLGLVVETLARCLREHSTYGVVVMVSISPSWRYNLSTPSTEGAGNVSRSLAITTMF
jgi:hypothetical protein